MSAVVVYEGVIFQIKDGKLHVILPGGRTIFIQAVLCYEDLDGYKFTDGENEFVLGSEQYLEAAYD